MVFKHVLPNALLPAINVVALTIAWLLGGVVVTEVVFNYPGLGRLVIESISNRDNSCAGWVRIKLWVCPLFVSVTKAIALRDEPVVFEEYVNVTDVVPAFPLNL